MQSFQLLGLLAPQTSSMPSQAFGTALHALLFEPAPIGDLVEVIPAGVSGAGLWGLD